jgi:hypothetical protein
LVFGLTGEAEGIENLDDRYVNNEYTLKAYANLVVRAPVASNYHVHWPVRCTVHVLEDLMQGIRVR